MIRFVLICFFLISFAFSSNNLFAKSKQKHIYTVQLFTLIGGKISDKKILKSIPLTLRNEIYLYRTKKLLRGCYSYAKSYQALLPKLLSAKKAGYKDAYITVTKVCYPYADKKEKKQLKIMRNILVNSKDKTYIYKTKKFIKESSTHIKNSDIPQIKPKNFKKAKYKNKHFLATRTHRIPVNKREKNKRLSKFIISKIIAEANRAYKNMDTSKAIMYYEMLIAGGVKNEKIKNNLCYLYGKNGAWSRAQNIIEKDYYPARLIYAYANGAVKTLQPTFYDDLHRYIISDRSGHLALLAGYYFEQNRLQDKAFKFYKMAYEKNRNDIYNIYAYARFLDIIGDKNSAKKLYIKVFKRIDDKSPLYKILRTRLYK